MKPGKYYTEQEEGWCAWCGEPLPTVRHWRTMFCGKACNNAYFNSLTAEARAEERAKLKCQRCGAPIVGAKKSDTKFCPACRNIKPNRGPGKRYVTPSNPSLSN